MLGGPVLLNSSPALYFSTCTAMMTMMIMLLIAVIGAAPLPSIKPDPSWTLADQDAQEKLGIIEFSRGKKGETTTGLPIVFKYNDADRLICICASCDGKSFYAELSIKEQERGVSRAATFGYVKRHMCSPAILEPSQPTLHARPTAPLKYIQFFAHPSIFLHFVLS